MYVIPVNFKYSNLSGFLHLVYWKREEAVPRGWRWVYYLVAKRRFLSAAAPITNVYIHKCLPSALVPGILGKNKYRLKVLIC